MQRGEGISAFMYMNGRTDRETGRERGRLLVLSQSDFIYGRQQQFDSNARDVACHKLQRTLMKVCSSDTKINFKM